MLNPELTPKQMEAEAIKARLRKQQERDDQNARPDASRIVRNRLSHVLRDKEATKEEKRRARTILYGLK